MKKSFIYGIVRKFETVGLNFKILYLSVRGMPRYLSDYKELKRQEKDSRHKFSFGSIYPCLWDRFDASGSATGHYFHQDLLVAQKIFKENPTKHIDIGSRIDGFVAHVASFRAVTVCDIRYLKSNVQNLDFQQLDLMANLPQELVESTDSISCLHALEHFGLGRYGDPIIYDGYLKGFENIEKLLKPGGTLYLSTPIGNERIEFNAHRVFSLKTLLAMFGNMHLEEFSFVDDTGNLHRNVPIEPEQEQNNFGCHYGCGIFQLRKPETN